MILFVSMVFSAQGGRCYLGDLFTKNKWKPLRTFIDFK